VTTGRLPVPLSVLDLCPVPAGEAAGEALRRSVDLAREAERLGMRRFWVAEHHNLPGIASAAPAVLAGQIAAATSSIRVGSGGVMLPNHPPLTVAEQFGTLEALHPGRIDLGIGRAPGTDRATARALRRSAEGLSAADFPAQLAELRGYFAGPVGEAAGQAACSGPVGEAAGQAACSGPVGEAVQPGPGGEIRAIPAEGNSPAIWLLGSTGYSAEIAARLGLPFAFAYHLSAANARPALALYRRAFQPSALLTEPYALISVFVLCAQDSAAARWRHGPARLFALRQRSGRPSAVPSPEEAAGYRYSAAEQDVMAETTAAHVVGDPAAVAGQLRRILADTGADELMVTTTTFAHADRLASYELLVQAMADRPAVQAAPW
jgi:luciferase family oxidoreductase group 1